MWDLYRRGEVEEMFMEKKIGREEEEVEEIGDGEKVMIGGFGG